VHSGKHKYGQIVWLSCKPLIYFKQLKTNDSCIYININREVGQMRREEAISILLASPTLVKSSSPAPKKHVRGSQEREKYKTQTYLT